MSSGGRFSEAGLGVRVNDFTIRGSLFSWHVVQPRCYCSVSASLAVGGDKSLVAGGDKSQPLSVFGRLKP